MARLQQHYREKVAPELMAKFGSKSPISTRFATAWLKTSQLRPKVERRIAAGSALR